MKDVARVGSNVSGANHHGSGAMVSSQQNKVLVHGVPVCVVGDKASNGGTLVSGSAKVFIDGKAVSGVGDKLDYGGTVLDGDSTLKIE